LMIETKRYSIRIKSVEHQVAVHCSKGFLPEWGFKQQEINGNKKVTEPENNWVVDHVEHARIVNGRIFKVIVVLVF
jgi:dolichyl-phosphate-mannose-protein mannosyltransferase